MVQPASIVNTGAQSLDTLYAADGTPLLKLAIGNKAIAGLTPHGGGQLVGTHADGQTFVAADPLVLMGGYDSSGSTPIRKILVTPNGELIAITRPTSGLLTDRSGTITAGGTAQTLMASNASRRYLLIINIDATEDLWINFTTAAVTTGQPSIPIRPGGAFVQEANFVSTELISVKAVTTGHAWTAKEG